MSGPAVPLYGYQQRWLKDRARYKVGMFARQTGKTFTTTLELVDDSFEHVAAGRRTRWVILSRGERQAREAMEEGVKRHCQAYELAIRDLEYDYATADGSSVRALEVELPGGTRITALPANPDTARGFSGNVFLDEFAIHQQPRAIWGALFPVASARGFKIRVTSTPKGKGNKFYELMTAKDSIWSRHQVDIYQAVREGLPRNIDEMRAGLNDDDLWMQEYELEWLDEASAWLSYELINACEHADAGKPELYAGGETFIGNDIARKKHLWVAWVWERVGDVLVTREIRELRGARFKEQDATLDELVHRYNPRRLAMDQTGMGEKPVEDAKDRYGEHCVEGVMFTAANKHRLATLGKQGFEDRKVRIPQGDRALREDLHSLKKLITPMGNVRFDTEDDTSSHADRAWAGFLGQYAATEFQQPPAGETVDDDAREAHVPDAMRERGRQPARSVWGRRRAA